MVAISQKQEEHTKAVIKSMLEDDMSYGAIGDVFGLNRGTIWYFYKQGRIPKSKEAQRKLGLENGAEIIVSIRRRREDGTFAEGKSNA